VTCQEAIALMGDYLELVLTAETLAELEAHLRDCAPCAAYLSTYRRTAELTRAATPTEMPAEMRARLREFLLARLARGEG
jgi:predicted anti-sigma-YlaC factor YlaD